MVNEVVDLVVVADENDSTFEAHAALERIVMVQGHALQTQAAEFQAERALWRQEIASVRNHLTQHCDKNEHLVKVVDETDTRFSKLLHVRDQALREEMHTAVQKIHDKSSEFMHLLQELYAKQRDSIRDRHAREVALLQAEKDVLCKRFAHDMESLRYEEDWAKEDDLAEAEARRVKADAAMHKPRSITRTLELFAKLKQRSENRARRSE